MRGVADYQVLGKDRRSQEQPNNQRPHSGSPPPNMTGGPSVLVVVFSGVPPSPFPDKSTSVASPQIVQNPERLSAIIPGFHCVSMISTTVRIFPDQTRPYATPPVRSSPSLPSAPMRNALAFVSESTLAVVALASETPPTYTVAVSAVASHVPQTHRHAPSRSVVVLVAPAVSTPSEIW